MDKVYLRILFNYIKHEIKTLENFEDLLSKNKSVTSKYLIQLQVTELIRLDLIFDSGKPFVISIIDASKQFRCMYHFRLHNIHFFLSKYMKCKSKGTFFLDHITIDQLYSNIKPPESYDLINFAKDGTRSVEWFFDLSMNHKRHKEFYEFFKILYDRMEESTSLIQCKV